jgi:hypothetical protein
VSLLLLLLLVRTCGIDSSSEEWVAVLYSFPLSLSESFKKVNRTLSVV